MIVGPRAIALMHHFEGCKLRAYLCPAGVPTIGWGNTYYLDGRKVRMGDTLTQAQADDLFRDVMNRDFASRVAVQIGDAPTTPAQFGAMVALAYNIGAGAFGRSSVLRFHKARDYAKACDAFLMWNKAGGKVMAGLTRRRNAEALLYAGRLDQFDAAIGCQP